MEKDISKDDSIDIKMPSIDSAAKIFAVAVGFIYICGFLTLSSHLYKYGVVDLDITNTNLLVPGATYIIYLLAFSLFAGRSILQTKKSFIYINELISERTSWRGKVLFTIVIEITNLTCSLCMSSLTFSIIALPEDIPLKYGLYILALFSFTQVFEFFDKDFFGPIADRIVFALFDAFLVIGFFYTITSTTPYIVLFLFLLMGIYLNQFCHAFEKHLKNGNLILASIGYLTFFTIFSTVAFGSLIYGNISKSLGGGQSSAITIGLKDRALENHPKHNKSTLSGMLTYISKERIYITHENTTLIIPQSSIQWMSVNTIDSQKKTTEKKQVNNELDTSKRENP